LTVVLALRTVSGVANIISRRRMSLPEEINIRHSSMRTSRIGRVSDDRVQVGDDMVAKDSIKIVNSTRESVRGEPVDVAVVGEGSELTGFVLGVKEGCGGLDSEVIGVEAQGDVEEAVDGDDVRVPLVDGVLDVALRGGGCGVEDAGEVLASWEEAVAVEASARVAKKDFMVGWLGLGLRWVRWVLSCCC
jgi:hypothetical protein